ncbi:hypothetical protein [Microcoleus sp. OTE_8_concoct_300]|uniref:hypothetical protein n=1 Tax=Microcoleus sp. OTE_8_concoct_300 TaxID=2964710 RepID=UPI00403F904F
MKKKVVLLVCFLISAGLGGGFCEVSIATKAIDRSKIVSADIPTPAADLSSVVLTLQDLPPGFTEVSSEYVASFRNKLSQGLGFKPPSLFAYQKIDSKLFELQLLIGFTVQLSDPIQQARFDQAIREGMVAKAVSQGLNSNKESQFTDPAALTLQDKIGEVSAGWRTQGKIENIPMNVDLALFRRGQIGVLMATMYLDGTKPPITISEAGRKLDSRMMELKPDLTQPK